MPDMLGLVGIHRSVFDHHMAWDHDRRYAVAYAIGVHRRKGRMRKRRLVDIKVDESRPRDAHLPHKTVPRRLELRDDLLGDRQRRALERTRQLQGHVTGDLAEFRCARSLELEWGSFGHMWYQQGATLGLEQGVRGGMCGH